uniref:Uncharacterized protein n=1 Tax=Eutreptiella gymnastica TaxID=73025 RepID=A0A7S1IU05_9EUGL
MWASPTTLWASLLPPIPPGPLIPIRPGMQPSVLLPLILPVATEIPFHLALHPSAMPPPKKKEIPPGELFVAASNFSHVGGRLFFRGLFFIWFSAPVSSCCHPFGPHCSVNSTAKLLN